MRCNILVSHRSIVVENIRRHSFWGFKVKSILFWFSLLLLGNTFISYMIHLHQIRFEDNGNISWIPFNIEAPVKFLIHNAKCKILDVQPWNEEVIPFHKRKGYKSCTHKLLLTKIVRTNGSVFLTVNKAAIKQYADFGVSCCYVNISRFIGVAKPDRYLYLARCRSFVEKVEIHTDAVLVNCYTDETRLQKVYSNTHATIMASSQLKRRISQFGKNKPPSVLIIGIDSVSRLNLARVLPATSNYLKRNQWISYEAYNKVGYNTFPNVMAMLTGHSLEALSAIGNTRTSFLDVYDIIWKDFRRVGYVTAYAEDLADMNTFTYLKKGFKEKPTDLYFRHYTLATETLAIRYDKGLIYCAGPEPYGERILNIAKDFVETFLNQPSFGFFWMNSFSHDDVNSPMRMDNKIAQFFTYLERKKVTDHTIIIFLSDHGIRYGKIRHTPTGWLEERLPFLRFWIPKSFKKAHEREFQNLQQNSRKLTTPYDLYMTLQHIMVLSGLNYRMRPSVSCPKCKSLFTEIEDVRSCTDASIKMEFCACILYKNLDPEDPLAAQVAEFLIEETRKIIVAESDDVEKCDILKLGRIRYARIAINPTTDFRNKSYLLVQFETNPKITLEATVRLEEDIFGMRFYLEGEVHRLDIYKSTGWCVSLDDVKKYCHCKWQESFKLHRVKKWLGIKDEKLTFI